MHNVAITIITTKTSNFGFQTYQICIIGTTFDYEIRTIRIYQLINFVIIIVDSEVYRYLVYFLFIQPNIEYNTLKNNMPVAQES